MGPKLWAQFLIRGTLLSFGADSEANRKGKLV